MRELFYEESSILINDEKASKKYYLYKTLSIISWCLIVVILFMPLFFLDFKVFNQGFLIILLNLLWYIVPIACLLFTAIFFWIWKNKQYVEYDYTLIEDTIRISKVIKNFKRKIVVRFGTNSIEKLGKFGSDTYNTYAKIPDIRREILTMNEMPAEGKDFYYLVVNLGGCKNLYIFECTETFMANVLRTTNKFILEKDFK